MEGGGDGGDGGGGGHLGGDRRGHDGLGLGGAHAQLHVDGGLGLRLGADEAQPVHPLDPVNPLGQGQPGALVLVPLEADGGIVILVLHMIWLQPPSDLSHPICELGSRRFGRFLWVYWYLSHERHVARPARLGAPGVARLERRAAHGRRVRQQEGEVGRGRGGRGRPLGGVRRLGEDGVVGGALGAAHEAGGRGVGRLDCTWRSTVKCG